MGSDESADPDSNTQPAHTTASLSCRFEEPSSGCLSPASQRGGPSFDPRSRHVAFLVDNVTLGQVISKYLGFPCQFSFHHRIQIHQSFRH